MKLEFKEGDHVADMQFGGYYCDDTDGKQEKVGNVNLGDW